MIIANVSPSIACHSETISTLEFMHNAKRLRNKPQVNLVYHGDVGALKKEIARLNNELDNLRKGYTDPVIHEAALLRHQLEE